MTNFIYIACITVYEWSEDLTSPVITPVFIKGTPSEIVNQANKFSETNAKIYKIDELNVKNIEESSNLILDYLSAFKHTSEYRYMNSLKKPYAFITVYRFNPDVPINFFSKFKINISYSNLSEFVRDKKIQYITVGSYGKMYFFASYNEIYVLHNDGHEILPTKEGDVIIKDTIAYTLKGIHNIYWMFAHLNGILINDSSKYTRYSKTYLIDQAYRYFTDVDGNPMIMTYCQETSEYIAIKVSDFKQQFEEMYAI